MVLANDVTVAWATSSGEVCLLIPLELPQFIYLNAFELLDGQDMEQMAGAHPAMQYPGFKLGLADYQASLLTTEPPHPLLFKQ